MATQQKTPVQILEEQKKRLATLQERRTRAQVKLENERRQLQEAQKEAMTLFGTSDLEELRKLYQTGQNENEQKVVEFELALGAVESDLADIERQINF